MIARGILIEWRMPSPQPDDWEDCDEYIEFDSTHFGQPISIKSTWLWWKNSRKLDRVNVTSATTKLANGGMRLLLRYDAKNNHHLLEDEILWGVATIDFYLGDDSGDAEWIDNSLPEWNGPAKWKIIDSGILKVKPRENISRAIRDKRFRSLLLQIDNRSCALTEEETECLLDAAHIVPSKNGGAEVAENGFLLRTDLHRLFDDGYFSFDPDGRIKFNTQKPLPQGYLELLRGKKLSNRITRRVRGALHHLLNPPTITSV